MTREEQIVKAAKKEIERIASHATLYKGTIDEIEVYEPDDMIDMFKLGAEWSDEHPDLYSVTRKAIEREREYMIDKFCEFMQSCEGYVVSGEKCNYENFMKFMEEQQ